MSIYSHPSAVSRRRVTDVSVVHRPLQALPAQSPLSVGGMTFPGKSAQTEAQGPVASSSL